MATGTPNDFHRSLVSKYGVENGEIAHFLLQEQSRLINDWRAFLFLFCGDNRRIGVMKEASEVFFLGFVRGALWDVTILRLRRLTDNNESRGNSNIGLKRLLELVPEERKDQQSRLVDDALERCKTVKKDVNKALAHNDLDSLLNSARFQTIRRDVTAAVKSVKLAIGHWQFEGDTSLAENDFPHDKTKDEQAMLARIYIGNTKYDDVRREALLKDLQNGSQAEPTKIYPDWLLDPNLRGKPF